MIQDFSTTILNPGLLAQIATVLEKRLNQGGVKIADLSKLGEIYRQLGMLEKAAEVYTRLACLNPEDERLLYLQALLTNKSLPPRPLQGQQPVPFVLYRNYLSAEWHQTLLPFALHSLADFEPSGVGENAEIQPDHSNSLTLHSPKEISQNFRRLVEESLPQILPRLRIPPFTIDHIQVEIKAYGHGHFFRPHTDDTPWNKRLINFGYYFHRQPRPFTGGDFLLYDTDFAKVEYNPMSLTRIVPEDNCIVFYPSAAFHEATTVHCPSGDFGDSRFAIIGHIQGSR